ncbi:PTS lactose/cellobiose transporter subunit IIA [Neobacillus thermocopriae]|jgi:cellobiose PTS system EIIA component|uniref:PTS lactose/cellobiose transporter subunit IIA n=1 Tax=Neobacillus thermocopriae TaxID=1215031 RepID=A0A6B3TQG0_9BACI|nr:PTS lactose/cellobiose transporter subunit IIA [Neobacillus thermocopriae]MED3622938.1 PTS lactose/cellobiose transporter subunit IIA [Neobacillus thermocopriae]MED3713212.1 PTS lactose/cellobiose transporter subunit IIA [Neobacillus thermocopriae]NEX79235.1 PTS lactose/cellobiose transporter subunit IIA [Neobacillus thermocopriae]
METNIEIIMSLIMNAGNSKSYSMEAIKAAKENDFSLAAEKLKEAETAINAAHSTQTSLLTKEANGEKTEISLLLIHGQDHLMNAITFLDMAKEFVTLYEKVSGFSINVNEGN